MQSIHGFLFSFAKARVLGKVCVFVVVCISRYGMALRICSWILMFGLKWCEGQWGFYMLRIEMNLWLGFDCRVEYMLFSEGVKPGAEWRYQTLKFRISFWMSISSWCLFSQQECQPCKCFCFLWVVGDDSCNLGDMDLILFVLQVLGLECDILWEHHFIPLKLLGIQVSRALDCGCMYLGTKNVRNYSNIIQ